MERGSTDDFSNGCPGNAPTQAKMPEMQARPNCPFQQKTGYGPMQILQGGHTSQMSVSSAASGGMSPGRERKSSLMSFLNPKRCGFEKGFGSDRETPP